MKPAPFTYHNPESLVEVLALLAEHGDNARPLAGGQSLLPELASRRLRVGHLIDLRRISELRCVTLDDEWMRIGAMTTQRSIERDPQVAECTPLLASATRLMGPPQVRNRGTIGGSLANAHPACEYVAVALALEAEIELAGQQAGRVAADQFFTRRLPTDSNPVDLLVSVHFPVWRSPFGFAIAEVGRRHGDFAIAGAAVAVGAGDARIALFGAAEAPFRSTPAEEALLAGALAEDIGKAAADSLEAISDVHASAKTRCRLIAHVSASAVNVALDELDARNRADS